MNAWNETVKHFGAQLREAGLRRALIVTQSGGLHCSHAVAEQLADSLRDDPNYDGHTGCFFELGANSGHLLTAFVHRTDRGQAAGGVRFWSYPTLGDLVRDGLRLSVGMGQKNALAGLWWGGGKGIIARQAGMNYDDARVRNAVFSDYGLFISGLAGCYVTAEDVGTRPQDMASVFSTTRHTTCIPPTLGGSGNPGILTARGVVVAMEAALDYIDQGDLAGKTIAMQGAGNVAVHMIDELLARKVASVTATDIDAAAVRSARQRFAGTPVTIEQCASDNMSILAAQCDVLVPNAVGGTLNPGTIPGIRARIVCGAANNQLEDPQRDAQALQDAGVLYIPDFVANRMGIVNCANEQYGVFDADPAIAAHLDRDHPEGVFQRVQDVLRRASVSARPPALEATVLADELARVPHPIWGNRAQRIIGHLVESGWAD